MHIDVLRGAAAVSRAGVVELTTASGPSDARGGAPCTPYTRFQIGSISKQFAATAVLLLAQAGALRLDSPLARWFPGAPPAWRAITPHQLLTHTSGLPHWQEGGDLRPDPPPAIEGIQAVALRSRPGSQWHYSAPGYLIAAYIVERAAGQPYPQYLAEHIFGPLGLTGTSTGTAPGGANLAHGHHAGTPVPSWDLTRLAGTADIWSTVADLARFSSAIHEGALLSAASRRAMFTRHAGLAHAACGSAITRGYGYGVFTGTIAGHRAFYHPGGNRGYAAFHAWLPEPQLTLTMLANDETTDGQAVLGQLLHAALDCH